MENISKESIKSLDINIHHIGGIGDCGPVDNFQYLQGYKWILYDADEGSLKETTNKPNSVLIRKCIGGTDGKIKFNISTSPSASSVYLLDEKAKKYSFKGDRKIWGKHAKMINQVELETYKLDTLIANGEIPKIDILSVDAQGFEYEIMQGAKDNFRDILAIVTEVEFTPLYKGQKLFQDTHSLLSNEGFILVSLTNTQDMYLTEQGAGDGFLVVAEPFYLRDPDTINDIEQLFKLAKIAIAIRRFDFGLKIIDRLSNMGLNLDGELLEFIANTKDGKNRIDRLMIKKNGNSDTN